MAKFTPKDYGSWNVWTKSYSRRELESRRRQLAKVANSRILSLERGTSKISGESLFSAGWYDIYTEYLESQGRRRFSEGAGYEGTDYNLRREISILEDFLAMRSSTVSGARAIENQRVQTFIDKGVPEEIATDARFYDFLHSETFAQLNFSALDSENIIDLIGEYSATKSLDDILSAFEAHLSKQYTGQKGIREELEKLPVKRE